MRGAVRIGQRASGRACEDRRALGDDRVRLRQVLPFARIRAGPVQLGMRRVDVFEVTRPERPELTSSEMKSRIVRLREGRWYVFAMGSLNERHEALAIERSGL